jgi:hypothetical protein
METPRRWGPQLARVDKVGASECCRWARVSRPLTDQVQIRCKAGVNLVVGRVRVGADVRVVDTRRPRKAGRAAIVARPAARVRAPGRAPDIR